MQENIFSLLFTLCVLLLWGNFCLRVGILRGGYPRRWLFPRAVILWCEVHRPHSYNVRRLTTLKTNKRQMPLLNIFQVSGASWML